jgi:hypothetical protein
MNTAHPQRPHPKHVRDGGDRAQATGTPRPPAPILRRVTRVIPTLWVVKGS